MIIQRIKKINDVICERIKYFYNLEKVWSSKFKKKTNYWSRVLLFPILILVTHLAPFQKYSARISAMKKHKKHHSIILISELRLV